MLGVGALYLFGQTATPEQRAGGTLKGSRTVQAQGNIDTTGYVPVQESATDWTHQGQTTARWSFTPR